MDEWNVRTRVRARYVDKVAADGKGAGARVRVRPRVQSAARPQR